jgi:hypothetical protein
MSFISIIFAQLARGSGTVVQYLPHQPSVEGSRPATATGTEGEKDKISVQFE